METIIPILVLAFIVLSVGCGLHQWHSNNNSPVLTEKATVIKKNKYWLNNMMHYSAKFELMSGAVMKFTVSRKLYQEIEEGAIGSLTYQGTRFKDFKS